jgi:hypothetical protein
MALIVNKGFLLLQKCIRLRLTCPTKRQRKSHGINARA